ncbi:MAG TPA: diguanylate cyclase [Pyrinomonadaceae bacterium]|nr:diguanylate cyclase [Pyrinomonadaceae bacterium]
MVGKFKVLVVDDEPDKLEMIAFALRREGYDVRTAADGIEGLDAVAALQPDLIITDVMMPRLDGYELARRVRSNPLTRFIPIIIQSAARGAAQDVRLGSEIGALGYITDPSDIDLLRARARTLLEFKDYLDSCEEAAFTDHLTGLANRRRFERQLEREEARTRRYGRPFCLLLLDVDNFKEVNDTNGHDAGDEAIRALANVIQSGTRGIDTGARVGGDELAVIMPETDFAHGAEAAERLRQAVAEREIANVGRITSSFGLAEFPTCARDWRALFAVADAALYEAKRRGRNRVCHAPLLPAPNPAPVLGVS